ncbi:hypothetical protein M409DRAFT_36910 [Zasmidium cellare ATCC 36951]|uniref:Major facilitator superfamily (MFS) profile domain-containing protein n=1 Tax=Zasmidium cellare ATCC 36951 TaxID=1080233 RepID=A0A6A6CFF0_ZASCE|nr:uncharacterized protein M409DRAFT_36910 [Zasmidium cellare ATCC 36951]KAF2165373.1 hypothetical protein M409DRAFT_36910 [Zasmidium cellare ATCC 36951]
MHSLQAKINKTFTESALAQYGRNIRSSPRQLFLNRHLTFTALFYATGAIPQTWDQGSSSTIANLTSFQHHFGISSGTNASAIKNFISFFYIGAAVGAFLCFFINDRIGRLWSLRLYMLVWIVGQMTAVGAPRGTSGLYAARIISGMGMGALCSTANMSLAEIAPAEIRGLLVSWYAVAMGVALVCSNFCVLGVYLHVAPIRLQYQIVWFAPCICLFVWIIASFWACESPRWLFLTDRPDQAVNALVQLRSLPADHPRVQFEIEEIKESVRKQTQFQPANSRTPGLWFIVKDAFTVPANLRRFQQVFVFYILQAITGANSITSYLVPILAIIGDTGGTARHIFISGMYGVAKLCFALISSFFLIDALGRRKSLFIGATTQMITDIYIGVFIKVQQSQSVSHGASEGAIAMIFIHAFGYAVGMYLFGGEIWPNHLRSFGSSVTQVFHWLLHYAMSYATPSLLEATDNWGAFIFFAAWCAVTILYVFLFVPETAGISVEELDELFQGSWFNAYRRKSRPKTSVVLDGEDGDDVR